MAVEFLSDERVAAFGRFVGEPTRAELERYFFLDDTDRAVVAKRRGEHHMLGLAVQLGTVRFLGTFLSDPLDVPTAVVDYVAVQLDIADASCIKRYAERAKTPWDHQQEIRAVYGYTDFAAEQVQSGLSEFVAGRAFTHAEGGGAGRTLTWRCCRRRDGADLRPVTSDATFNPVGQNRQVNTARR